MKAVHLVAEEVKHAPVMLKEAIEFF
ncbi:MAG TPA: hypothetical protein DDY25_07220, partial [Peptococcaceae bacterium]|nr:hypothetical protein [Peptococcaceae bacterium]